MLGNELAARKDGSVLPVGEAAPLSEHGRLRSLGANAFLIAVLSPFLALTNRSVEKILLAVVVFDIPLQFGHHFFYRENEAALGALGGLSISATTVALAGLYLSWLMQTLVKKDFEARPSFHVNAPLLFYFVICAISVLVAQDASLALFEVCLLLEACLLYFYVANTVRTKQDVLFVVLLLLIACLVESTIMILMRVTLTPSTDWSLPIHLHAEGLDHGGLMRVGGTVGSPNFAAAYLSVSMASAASVLFTELGRVYKFLAMTVLALGTVALIFTFSRGGWMALALSSSVICLAVWSRRGVSLKKPIAVVLLLTMLYLPFHTAVSARLFADDNGSAESRIPLMKLAFRIIEDHPILGVGANNFTVVMGRYLTSDFREGFLFAVHDKYLLVFAETGIVGLIAFLAFFLGAVRRGWQCWGFHDRLLSPLALGFAAGIVGNMFHMNVDVFRGRPTQQLLWLIAGLLAAMHRICKTPSLPHSAANAS